MTCQQMILCSVGVVDQTLIPLVHLEPSLIMALVLLSSAFRAEMAHMQRCHASSGGTRAYSSQQVFGMFLHGFLGLCLAMDVHLLSMTGVSFRWDLFLGFSFRFCFEGSTLPLSQTFAYKTCLWSVSWVFLRCCIKSGNLVSPSSLLKLWIREMLSPGALRVVCPSKRPFPNAGRRGEAGRRQPKKSWTPFFDITPTID